LRCGRPFCWWVAVAIDHVSRAVVGFAVFREPPRSTGVQGFLERAIDRAGGAPRYVITDRGRQFRCAAFRRWRQRRGVRIRFGAVGTPGSIAVVERFIRSLKSEGSRQVVVPLRQAAMRRELDVCIEWYNTHRPHQALRGCTPREVYAGLRFANTAPRFEPRGKWPRAAGCASPQAEIRGRCGTKVSLVVGHVEGRRHLPVVDLRKAA
jgi:transposase InsO family protein